MLVGLSVQACHQLGLRRQLQRGRHAASDGLAIRVAERTPFYRRIRPHAVVVHHVVDVVAIDVGLDLAQQRRDIALFEAQADVLAIEPGAVHHAVGIGRLAIAAAIGQFVEGVVIRRQAQGDTATPALIVRVHLVATALLVVVRTGIGSATAHIKVRRGVLQITHQVAAAKIGHGGAQVAGQFRLQRTLAAIPLEQHRAGHVARAVDHGLRPLEHGQAVIGVGKHIGGRRVHAAAAATQDVLAIQQHVQARSGHAAQHRVAIGATLADHGEAGNGLEDVGSVLRRNRLARLARIGHDGEWLAGSSTHTGTGHDDAVTGTLCRTGGHFRRGSSGNGFRGLCQQGGGPGQNGEGDRGQHGCRQT